MKKLTFLITTPAYYPGPDISCVSDLINAFATGLARRGYAVHILHSLDASASRLRSCSSDWEEIAAKWETEHPGVFIHTLRSPLKVVDSLFAYLFGSSPYVNKQFSNIIKEVKPDVVHHHSPMFFGHQILRKRNDYLSVYTAHGYWMICQRAYLLKDGRRPCDRREKCFSCAIRSRKPPQLGRYTRGFRKAISDIDLILAPSMAVKERLSVDLETRIECIPHYVPYPKRIVKSSGYSNYFLFAGALEMHKGILNLLEAFRAYFDEIRAKLIIVGRGRLENQIKQFIARHNLQSKVIFLGWINKEMLWSLYRDALALVVPSINLDPAPTVIMEALSVGTPAIGSDRGGIPEMISKLDRGLIFHGGDVEGLGKILMRYKREEYPPQKVREVCEKWFSVERYISRYLDVLESVMGNPKVQ